MKRISQSLIRELIDKHGNIGKHCAREIYHCYFAKDFNRHSEAMLDGQFGEYLLLGGGAKGQMVKELPLTERGKVPVRETRIRQQALNAQVKIFKHKIEIFQNVNTQVPIACYFEDTDWVLLSELDNFPTQFHIPEHVDEETGEIIPAETVPAVIDFKWCQDYNEFAYNAWDDYANMDKIQPDSIFYMLEHFDLELTKEIAPEYDKRVGVENIYNDKVLNMLEQFRFFYFIVAYKSVDPSLIRTYEHSKYEKSGGKLSNIRQIEFIERTHKAIDLLEDYMFNGWSEKPYSTKFRGCRQCPVNIANKSAKNPCAYCQPRQDTETF